MSWRILLIGGTGQLGTAMRPLLAPLGEVLAPGRQDLDITAPDAAARIIARRPTHVILAAAATDVEQCEREPAWAQAVMRRGAGGWQRHAARSKHGCCM